MKYSGELFLMHLRNDWRLWTCWTRKCFIRPPLKLVLNRGRFPCLFNQKPRFSSIEQQFVKYLKRHTCSTNICFQCYDGFTLLYWNITATHVLVFGIDLSFEASTGLQQPWAWPFCKAANSSNECRFTCDTLQNWALLCTADICFWISPSPR